MLNSTNRSDKGFPDIEAGFRNLPEQGLHRQNIYLKDTDEGLGEVVKVATPYFCVFKVISASKELHAQQGKDDNEKKEQQQQRGNGTDGVEQRCHQIAQ